MVSLTLAWLHDGYPPTQNDIYMTDCVYLVTCALDCTWICFYSCRCIVTADFVDRRDVFSLRSLHMFCWPPGHICHGTSQTCWLSKKGQQRKTQDCRMFAGWINPWYHDIRKNEEPIHDFFWGRITFLGISQYPLMSLVIGPKNNFLKYTRSSVIRTLSAQSVFCFLFGGWFNYIVVYHNFASMFISYHLINIAIFSCWCCDSNSSLTVWLLMMYPLVILHSHGKWP